MVMAAGFSDLKEHSVSAGMKEKRMKPVLSFVIALSILSLLAPPACTPEEEAKVKKSVDVMATAVDRSKQLQTMQNMQRFGNAIEQYIMLNSTSGAPKVANINELEDILQESEILQPGQRLVDGWGNPLIYTCGTGNSRDYTLTSYGADARPGTTPSELPSQMKYNADIVWTNGQFTQQPEGN